MNMSAFKSIDTHEGLENFIRLLYAYGEQHGVCESDLLRVVDSPLPETTYFQSTVCREYIKHNWFSYKEGNFYGLAKSRVRSIDMVCVTPASYLSFACIHDNVWLCRCADSTSDLWIKDKLVLHGVLGHDVISLGDIIAFLQVDTATNRFLVCCDFDDMYDGVFIPKDIDSFVEYFRDKVEKLGYSGRLDNIPISSVFCLFYEVCNCIFDNANYEYLSLEKESTNYDYRTCKN